MEIRRVVKREYALTDDNSLPLSPTPTIYIDDARKDLNRRAYNIYPPDPNRMRKA